MEDIKLKDALKTTMEISRLGNQYLQEQQPWVLIKDNKPRCGTVVAVGVNLVKLLATLLEPFLPHFTEKVLHQLDLPHSPIPDAWAQFEVAPGHTIRAAVPIFREITAAELKALKARFAGSQTEQAQRGAAETKGAKTQA